MKVNDVLNVVCLNPGTLTECECTHSSLAGKQRECEMFMMYINQCYHYSCDRLLCHIDKFINNPEGLNTYSIKCMPPGVDLLRTLQVLYLWACTGSLIIFLNSAFNLG